MDEGRGVDRLCPIRQATTNPVDRYGCRHVVFVSPGEYNIIMIIMIIVIMLIYYYR